MATKTEPENFIKTLRNDRNVTVEQLAEKIGISPSYMSRIENGLRPLSEINALKIASVLGVSVYEVSPEVASRLPDMSYMPEGGDQRGGVIPVMGKVAAGNWLEIDASVDEPLFTLPIARDPSGVPQFGLLVEGTSINKVARAGDVLVCQRVEDLTDPLVSGDLVIVERRMRQNGLKEVTAKRIRSNNGKLELWPESDDPKWQNAIPYTVDGDETAEVVVVALVRWIYRTP